MEVCMKRLLPVVVFVLVAAFSIPAVAQRIEIKGTVVSQETGEALAGVSVYVKGTQIGAASDVDGNFTFAYDATADFTLTLSYIGFKTIDQDYSPGDDLSSLMFEMLVDPFLTDEVVVTGIASRTSKAISEVAVTRVSTAEFVEKSSYSDISQLLTGKMAGVHLQSTSGNLGVGFKFRIRSGGGITGNGQPLIYVDGVRMDNSALEMNWVGNQTISTLTELNPEEIEKVEILKGPAGAASYGTRGSNGVVLITTKRGGAATPGRGRSYSINYSGRLGYNTQAHEFTEEDYLNYQAGNNCFRKGIIEKNNMNVTGGTGTFKYYAAYDRSFEKGHAYSNFLDKSNARANFDLFPSENFTLRVSSGFAYSEIRNPLNDNALYGMLAGTWLCTVPWSYCDSVSTFEDWNYQRANTYVGSITAEFRPFKGFEGRLTFGANDGDRRADQTRKPGNSYGGVTKGSRNIEHRNNQQFTYHGDVRYSYDLYGVNISSSVGAQIFDRRVKSFRTGKRDYLTALITTIAAGEVYTSASESLTHIKEAGIFTEHSFSYQDKYFGSFMIRKDYATVVGIEAPSIIYPRASFSIRLDKFGFTPSLFNLLKFRVAYGETGQLPGRLDGIAFLWQASSYGTGVGATMSRIGNEEIEPERVKELELGFDMEFFNNYGLDLTYYIQKAQNSIISFGNIPSSGLTASSVPINIGAMKGQGLEVKLNAEPIRTRNFQTTFTLINNFNSNEVTDLGGSPPIYSGYHVVDVGMPKGQFYYYKPTGATYYDDPEDPKYGRYRGATQTPDREDLGPGFPRWTGSFNATIRFFKNFQIYALADWMAEFKIRNMTRRFQLALTHSSGSVVGRYRELQHMLNLRDWTDWLASRGQTLTKPAYNTPEYEALAEEMSKMDYAVRGNFIEWGDFLKIRELSLSYDFTDLLPKFGVDKYIRRLNVGGSVRNLWMTTKYSWIDPEVLSYGTTSSIQGANDFDTLPHPRVWQMWLRVTF